MAAGVPVQGLQRGLPERREHGRADDLEVVVHEVDLVVVDRAHDGLHVGVGDAHRGVVRRGDPVELRLGEPVTYASAARVLPIGAARTTCTPRARSSGTSVATTFSIPP
jgi:hypothetical protein